MKLSDIRLSLLPFPQRWDKTTRTLSVNALLLPTTDPLVEVGDIPKFATQAWKLRAVIRPDPEPLQSAPTPDDWAQTFTVTPPAGAPALFAALRDELNVANPVPTPALQAKRLAGVQNVTVSKELPDSYRAAAGKRPTPDLVSPGHEFGCDLRDSPPTPPPTERPPKTLTWGAVYSFALKQPMLARELGLIQPFTLTLDDTLLGKLKTGGWLKLELDPAAGIDPGKTWSASFGARLPALSATADAAVFTAVLFPSEGFPVDHDDAIAEALRYQDGFAKIVHAAQAVDADAASSGHSAIPPATDVGVDVGWDDEQILLWANRQFRALQARLENATTLHCPLGVSGYRVDVRDADVVGAPWESLCSAFSAGPMGKPAALSFPANNPVFAKPFTGELTVDAAPSKRKDSVSQRAWLPRYFARWQGRSLVVPDLMMLELTGSIPNNAEGQPMTPGRFPYAAPPLTTKLRYGHRYEFRVRLVDLTGGGPDVSAKPSSVTASTSTTIRFLRHLPPKSLRVTTDDVAPDPLHLPQLKQLKVDRPLLGYPELVFAGAGEGSVLKQLSQDVAKAQEQGRSVGVPDPHVTTIRIRVQVRLPAHDRPADETRVDEGGFYTIYEHTLPLAAGGSTSLTLKYVPCDNIAAMPVPPANSTELRLPSARDIRLRLQAVCADPDHVFATPELRVGLVSDFLTRGSAVETTPTLDWANDADALSAIWARAHDAFVDRIADRLKLAHQGLRFAARPGERVWFGASAAIRHQIENEGSAIRFGSDDDLLKHWIVPVQLELHRDWTWQGFAPAGVRIERRDARANGPWNEAGLVGAPFSVSTTSLQPGATEDADKRARTRLVFFDAVNGNPGDGALPHPLSYEWRVVPIYDPSVTSAPPAPPPKTLDLPITTPPRQVPRVVSAGLALSKYTYDEEGYSFTEPRRRALWLEFEEPLENEKDLLFARVLAYGPDPLLASQISRRLDAWDNTPTLTGAPTAFELQRRGLPNPPPFPELPIPAEELRVIVPGQKPDSAGQDAMLPMLPAKAAPGEKPRHYLVPLPPGVAEDAPELFGFWTYEIRVGHDANAVDNWSTAQARFGQPLIVTGVQHPPPSLRCAPLRIPPQKVVGGALPGVIRVSAPYAQTVFEGRSQTRLEIGDPLTTIWIYLYAQVEQMDGTARRNFLLTQAPAKVRRDLLRSSPNVIFGEAEFSENDVRAALQLVGLSADAPLSVVAVEYLPSGGTMGARDALAGVAGAAQNDLNPANPLGKAPTYEDARRILRCSPLTRVPEAC